MPRKTRKRPNRDVDKNQPTTQMKMLQVLIHQDKKDKNYWATKMIKKKIDITELI